MGSLLDRKIEMERKFVELAYGQGASKYMGARGSVQVLDSKVVEEKCVAAFMEYRAVAQRDPDHEYVMVFGDLEVTEVDDFRREITGYTDFDLLEMTDELKRGTVELEAALDGSPVLSEGAL